MESGRYPHTENRYGQSRGDAYAGPAGIAPMRWHKLVDFLGDLPVATASRLLAVLERDRVRGGAGLPHDDLIKALRENLIKLGASFPARAKTAQRVFFTPFEDFIVPARRGRKRRARIARASLDPIWQLLMRDPACGAAGDAAAALDGTLHEGPADLGQPVETDGLEQALFQAAADGFGRLIALAETDAGFRADLSQRLATDDDTGPANAGAATLHDLAELNLLLPSVHFLKTMQRQFKKPFETLSAEEFFVARTIYADAHAVQPEAGPYVLLCLAGRMESPWRAMGLYYHLSRLRDQSISSVHEDAGAIAETLLDDLEGMVRALEREGDYELDADGANSRLGYVAEFTEGMMAEANLHSDGVIANRIEACRDIAAQSLDRFTEQSLAAIRKALPTRHAGGSSKLMSLRPDINRNIDQRLQASAEEAAIFIGNAHHHSKRLQRTADEEAIVEDAVVYVRRYANDLVLEIRAAEGEDRMAARQLMDASLSVAGPLLEAREIALLREKAAAAAVSA